MSNYYNTILIVDDNPAILTALKICLAGVFTRIVTLSSTDRLVATMSEEHVDVVLLDMNFSLGVNTGQDGLFWLRTLKKLHPDTPVVLMTAYADVQLAVKGLKNGAADFVTKPWDNDELVHVARRGGEESRSGDARQARTAACASRGRTVPRQYEQGSGTVRNNKADAV